MLFPSSLWGTLFSPRDRPCNVICFAGLNLLCCCCYLPVFTAYCYHNFQYKNLYQFQRTTCLNLPMIIHYFCGRSKNETKKQPKEKINRNIKFYSSPPKICFAGGGRCNNSFSRCLLGGKNVKKVYGKLRPTMYTDSRKVMDRQPTGDDKGGEFTVGDLYSEAKAILLRNKMLIGAGAFALLIVVIMIYCFCR